MFNAEQKKIRFSVLSGCTSLKKTKIFRYFTQMCFHEYEATEIRWQKHKEHTLGEGNHQHHVSMSAPGL